MVENCNEANNDNFYNLYLDLDVDEYALQWMEMLSLYVPESNNRESFLHNYDCIQFV